MKRNNHQEFQRLSSFEFSAKQIVWSHGEMELTKITKSELDAEWKSANLNYPPLKKTWKTLLPRSAGLFSSLKEKNYFLFDEKKDFEPFSCFC